MFFVLNLFELVIYSPNFESLEKLELITKKIRVSQSTQQILQFFKILDTNLVNLKLLTINFNEPVPDIFYDSSEDNFNISPDSLKDYINYKDKISVYDGKAKIKIYHRLFVCLQSSPERAVGNYSVQLKEKLQDFEHSSKIRSSHNWYYYKNSSNITETFELNISIEIAYYK